VNAGTSPRTARPTIELPAQNTITSPSKAKARRWVRFSDIARAIGGGDMVGET